MGSSISNSTGAGRASNIGDLKPVGGATDLNKLLGLPAKQNKLPVMGSQKPVTNPATGRVQVKVVETGIRNEGRRGTVTDTNGGPRTLNTTLTVNQPKDLKGTGTSASLGVVVPTPVQGLNGTASWNLLNGKVTTGGNFKVGNSNGTQATVGLTTDGKSPTATVGIASKGSPISVEWTGKKGDSTFEVKGKWEF
jgi:hypothetical protein